MQKNYVKLTETMNKSVEPKWHSQIFLVMTDPLREIYTWVILITIELIRVYLLLRALKISKQKHEKDYAKLNVTMINSVEPKWHSRISLIMTDPLREICTWIVAGKLS